MKSGKKLLSSILLIAALGCASTVAPKVPKAAVASFDGNVQNSGLIGFDAAGSGILTPHARDRYNALVAVYGSKFTPPVTGNDGITATTTNTFLIDRQHLVYFATMSRWKKDGK